MQYCIVVEWAPLHGHQTELGGTALGGTALGGTALGGTALYTVEGFDRETKHYITRKVHEEKFSRVCIIILAHNTFITV